MADKFVVLELTTRYIVSVPADWEQQMIEFHRGESSFCIGNDIHSLSRELDKQDDFGLLKCGCSTTEIKYLREPTDEDLERLPHID